MDKKNIVIALLVGLLTGSWLTPTRADTSQNISRDDLFKAAALCGILANPAHDPFGVAGFTALFQNEKSFTKLAKRYSVDMTKR